MYPLVAVITTIQVPTFAVRVLNARLRGLDAPLIVVGDRKGPDCFEADGAAFFDLERQFAMPFELARIAPVGHYTRKNLGYLEAIRLGACCIYETDDDNQPLAHWAPRSLVVDARTIRAGGWVNVYRCFSDARIWPRGLPLDELLPSFQQRVPVSDVVAEVRAPIQQGLANGSPDVDAIWRLVLDQTFEFDSAPSVMLPPGAWCPFNSQSTWWWPEAYPLLYLPSYCSFRMTDIWRSFVAQRCLWELGAGTVFHTAEVFQDRNEHNLMRDFNDEIPGYQRNRDFVRVLEDTHLQAGPAAVTANLLRCYEALVGRGFFDRAELQLLSAWREGLEIARRGG